jgi:hypothetical protein
LMVACGTENSRLMDGASGDSVGIDGEPIFETSIV